MAGKGNSLKLIPKIKKILDNLQEEYIIEITKAPGQAIELVKTYVQVEDYRVYAVGGDGTLNEVLNGMVDSNSCLGVIPAGSGNDYIKSITEDASGDIIQRTIIGKERLIDIGKINDRYFLNVASVGIDAKIAFNAKKLKKLPIINGFTAYFLSIIYTLIKYKNELVSSEIDDYKFHEITVLVAFGKGTSYGGGMKVLPNALIDNGCLEVCYVKGMNKFRILTLFPTLIKGTHGAFTKYVSFFKCKTAKVSSEVEIPINIDGEIIMSKEVNFSVLPKKIKFIVP